MRLGLGLGISRLQRATGGAPAFSPADLSPTAWFRVMSVSSLFQTDDTSTPVTAVPQSIGRMNDFSGGLRHATQATAGSRPTYSRLPVGGVRRNRYLQTEDITISPWLAEGTASFTANTGVDLDGNTTLDRVNFNGLFGGVRQNGLGIAISTTYTVSFDCRRISGSNPLTIQSANGNVTYTDFNPTSTLTRYSITFASTANSDGLIIQDRVGGGGVGAVDIGRFQLEIGATATAYQKVVTANDVTQTGLADVFYASDDGGDSINWTAPAGTYTIAYVVPNGTVTILTGQALSGAADALIPAQLVEYVAVNRALTGPETTALTTYLTGVANP
jgi:hypothetical protein